MRLIDLITPVAPPLCAGCDGWAGRDALFCAACRRALRWLPAAPLELGPGLDAWAPVAYEGPARGAVRALKFRAAPSVSDDLAAAIVARAPAGWLAPGALLVPVPLHPSRHRRRGYDQAERLATAIAARAGSAIDVAHVLRRSGHARTQMGRGRGARLLALHDAYEVANPLPADRPLVLVDDVITTGATLRACAQALRRAGARTLSALAYARTPGR